MANEKIASSKTLCELFLNRVEESGTSTAYEIQIDDEWHATTWDEYSELVSAFTLGIASLGIQPGTRAAIWGDTGPEWTIADLAIMTHGGCAAGIYQTCTPDQAAYIINDSDSRVVVVDTADRLEKALAIHTQTPQVDHYVIWSGDASDQENVHHFNDVLAMGRAYEKEHPQAYQALVDSVTPDTTAVLVYTSGTTGPPKGARLSHTNCIVLSKALHARFSISPFIGPNQSALAFLPMSHVAENVVGFIGRIYNGTNGIFCTDMAQFAALMRVKKPTQIGGVPRLFEKIYAAIQEKIDTMPAGKRRLVNWSLKVGEAASEYRMMRQSLPFILSIKHSIADALALSKLRMAFGGRAEYIICGSAPMANHIITFFQAIGIPFYEVYGLTESTGISHMNSDGQYKAGTVGTVLDGYECKIASDGEILLHGEGIFQGYLNKPEATAEALDADGWLYTGDIGEVDADGFLRITDRKKNLIITAGGKNVAPTNIELLICREKLIAHVVVIGERRNYLTALITLSTDALEALKGEEAFSSMSIDEIRKSDTIGKRIDTAVTQANEELARYENIRKFTILDGEFSIENGELTPTLKVKRKVVTERYADEIEAFYAS
jgi:long-chain acyl-CoA synthetase